MTTPNTTTTPTPGPRATDTLFGGRAVACATQEGTTTPVTVRQVRMSELPAYRALERDEFARLCFVTGLTADALDALPPTDFERLLEADGEVNGPLARRQEARETATQARELAQMRTLMPELYERVAGQAAETMRGAMAGAMPLSASSSPTSPSSAD